MQHEQILLNVLKSSGAHSIDDALSPQDLIKKCQDAGIPSAKEVEAALVSLIDQDLVEYEMNANTDVTHIWLL